MYSAAARSFSVSPQHFVYITSFTILEKKLHQGTTYLLSSMLTIFLKPSLLTVFIGHTSLNKWDCLFCFQCVFVSWSTCCNSLTFMDIFCYCWTLHVSHCTVFLGLHALIMLQLVVCFQMNEEVSCGPLWCRQSSTAVTA